MKDVLLFFHVTHFWQPKVASGRNSIGDAISEYKLACCDPDTCETTLKYFNICIPILDRLSPGRITHLCILAGLAARSVSP